MKKSSQLILGTLILMLAAVAPCGAQDDLWDFVYNGDKIPEDIIAEGGTDWQPRSGETNGRPKYETSIDTPEAQIGGLWSRRDDNSEDPNAPGASSWARGYLFGTNIYDQWQGKMTLVLRIRDLGTDSQKSVVDIRHSGGDYWTLGHVAESAEGPAGWEFGQTNDGRNANGLSDVRTGGYNEFVIIRITIEDTNPNDGVSRLRAWQDGTLVYDSIRGNDIGPGQFGEIAFRRTSGGNQQHMEIDWVRMSFKDVWAPGEGPETPNGNNTDAWDFVYLGDKLPQRIVDEGGTDWQPRSGETNGRPKYESIVSNKDIQIGGAWSRRDDNSDDPNAPGASSWARGYLFGTDVYNRWNGTMTLVVRIKDLGTDSQKSVIDITNSAGNYWTLGHVAASAEGPAGWEFGQTNDGRNANGVSDVRTGGFGKFVIIRITIVDNDPTDGSSFIRAWQDGVLVYESERTDDIGPGQFGEIAFRRTSGGNQQHMEIDWVFMKFGAAWAPGEGAATPGGPMDGKGVNVMNFPNPNIVNGVVGMDTFGAMRTVADSALAINPIFQVDQNGVPVDLNIFFLGFDAFRDLELAANDRGAITGVIALDKFGAAHPYEVKGIGESVSGPNVPNNGPKLTYGSAVAQYNAGNPDPVILPYFGGFDANGNFTGLTLSDFGITEFTGGDNAIARDIELAVDWHQTTNAVQGYFLLDAFAGIHYVNNPEVLAFLNRPENRSVFNTLMQDSQGNIIVQEPVGYQKFQEIFGFKPIYVRDYVGANPSDNDIRNRSGAPYFFGFPIARDLEIITRFDTQGLNGLDLVSDSNARNTKAIQEGIDVENLFTPIAMADDRANPNSPNYAPSVAVTSGYAILDGFGGVHSLVEDQAGNAIPAPWESVATGKINVDAPYFYPLDLAIDLEVYPDGGGFAVLTRLGRVFTVNSAGTTAADHFANPAIVNQLPFFGFDVARDLSLIPDANGKIVGIYVLDRFGTVHAVGQAPKVPNDVLFFINGKSMGLEVSPYIRSYHVQ